MSARLSIFCLLVALLYVGCRSEAPIELGQQVETRDVQLTTESGSLPYFSGKLVNLTDEAIPSVQVKVNLYDAQNTKVDEMVFPVRNLMPGEEVAFREVVNTDASVASARIDGVLRL